MEELKTSIEELRSANRRLDATLESAHAANEQLRVANSSLERHLENLVKSHDDLNNLTLLN